jgi:hypothetical protein
MAAEVVGDMFEASELGDGRLEFPFCFQISDNHAAAKPGEKGGGAHSSAMQTQSHNEDSFAFEVSEIYHTDLSQDTAFEVTSAS